MPSQWQTWALPFVGGVDTKTDGKLLAPPRLSILENGVFTKHGSVKRRAGYDVTLPRTLAGVDITDPVGLATRSDELLLAAGGSLYSYDSTNDGWSAAGPMAYLTTAQANLANTNSAQLFADVCTHGGVTVAAWEDSRGGVYVSAYDSTTGSPYITDHVLDADGLAPAVVVVDGSILVFWYNDSSFDIKAQRVVLSNVRSSVQAASVTVRSDASNLAPTLQGSASFDVVSLGTTAALVYHADTEGDFYLAIVDAAATALSSTLLTSRGGGGSWYTTAVDANDTNIYVVCATSTGIYTGTYPIASISSGSTGLEVAIGAPSYRRVTIAAGTAGATLFWQEGGLLTDGYNHLVKVAPMGSPGSAVTIRHSKLASRAFMRGDYAFVHLLQESDLQSTYFLWRSDGHLCGKYNYGLAGNQSTNPRLPAVQEVADDQFVVALRTKRRLDIATTTVSSDRYTHDNFKRTVHTFGEASTFHAIQSGGATYFAGGLLWQYDGQAPVESGFLLYPENGEVAIDSSGTPAIPVGTYNYRVYFEWTNGYGERERSSAVAFQYALVAGTRRILITCPTLAHTLRQGTRSNVALVIYRTETLGTTYYRCSSPDPTTVGAENGWLNNDVTADTVVFTDNMTDATLRTKEPDYQNTGEFDNTAPDSGSVLAGTSSRLFLAGGCIPSNTVLYSKQRGLGQPAGEFNGNLTIRVDEAGGVVTALAELNGELIVFKRDRIYAVSGEGPNDLGGGSFYGQGRLIASDVGCTKPRTVVLTPAGLMFVSGRGIYLLGNGGVQYVGAPVEGYNGQDYVSAQVIPGQNVVTFLTSEGTTVVYDYLFNQWSTWTNHEGVDSTLWGDTYCYVNADGRVFRQNGDIYTDGGVPYVLHFRTAPVRPPDAGIQEWWRCRRASVLGEYISSHQLVMGLIYDRDDYASETVTFDPDSVLNLATWGDEIWGSWADGYWGGLGTREYQFELRCARQKCETVAFDFYDIPGTPSGAGYELTELALEWAPKSGLNKQSATRKV